MEGGGQRSGVKGENGGDSAPRSSDERAEPSCVMNAWLLPHKAASKCWCLSQHVRFPVSSYSDEVSSPCGLLQNTTRTTVSQGGPRRFSGRQEEVWDAISVVFEIPGIACLKDCGIEVILGAIFAKAFATATSPMLV